MIVKQIASDLADLIEKKNKAYGNAFAKTTEILKQLYPNGIKVEQYSDIHVIVRVLDKLSRIANNNDPFGESPYQDIAGYSLLALNNKDMNKTKANTKPPKKRKDKK